MHFVLVASLTLTVLSMAISARLLQRKPKLVAFDLDGTIWSPDMYELVQAQYN